MARYIDADALIEDFNNDVHCLRLGGMKGTPRPLEISLKIEDVPTADVAPKSEVVKALNDVELLIIITKEAYKQQMEDAPNELSKQSKRTKWIAFEKFYEQFAELKKKYTGEVEGDG